MKQDRFLMVILGVIGLMVVLAVVLFFLRQEPLDYGPEDAPEGVVRNYILALQKEDFKRAYGYLQDSEKKPDFTTFHQALINNGLDFTESGVQIGQVRKFGAEAAVDLTILHHSGSPFERGWDENSSALLILQDGRWKIMSMPYPYWGWNWYGEK